jgi:hypothetical protein
MRERLKRRLVKLEAAAELRDAPPRLVVLDRPHTWPADRETVAAWVARAAVQQARLAMWTEKHNGGATGPRSG